MEIRFISTLTPEDEESFAPALLHAAAAILDKTALAYTLRIETTSEKVFQHHHLAMNRGRDPATPRRLDAQWLAQASVAGARRLLP